MEPYVPEKLPPKSIDWEMHISLRAIENDCQ